MNFTPTLPTFQPTDLERVRQMRLPDLVERAIAVLRENEPVEGYFLADSFGKDSCVIRKLAQLATVKHQPHHSFTTIDPPELLRFGKEAHPETVWVRPQRHMMLAVAEHRGLPPTRRVRWCCEDYKENGGNGRVCIFGVRAAESPRRKAMWREVRDDHDKKARVVCPIVYWSDEQLWEFINAYNVPVCSLYHEGFTRLGCVGCPLAKKESQQREFQRWPKYKENWHRAIIENWERMRTQIREDGAPFAHASFPSGDALWIWWLTERHPEDVMRDDCQLGLRWTNQELDELNP